MNPIRKYPSLVFISVAVVLFSFVHLFRETDDASQGVETSEANAARASNGIPIIEEHWIKESVRPGLEKWHDGIRGINSSLPVHLYKEIVRDSGEIQLEKDAFHFEFSDSIQYRLLLFLRYGKERATAEREKNELIIYEPRKFPPSHSRVLSREQADSVLQAWLIKI